MMTQVNIVPRYCGIPLPNITSVKAALTLFAKGLTNSSTRYTFEAVKDTGGRLVDIKLLSDKVGLPYQVTTLLQGLSAEHEEKLGEADGAETLFSKYCDYAPAPFFKTDVEVMRLADGTFILRMHQAYRGDEAEENLARVLGVERALLNVTVQSDVPSVDNRHIFDLDRALNAIKTVFGCLDTDKDRFVARIHESFTNRELTPLGQEVLRDGRFMVCLCFGKADRPELSSVPVNGGPTWQIKGVTGIFGRPYNFRDDGGYQTPRLEIVISKPTKQFALWNPACITVRDKTEMLGLAEKLAEVFADN